MRRERSAGARGIGRLEFVRSRNNKIPIFFMAERGEASSIPIGVMEMVDEFIWTLEDTAAFVGGRVVAAMRRYLELLLPPMAAACARSHPGIAAFPVSATTLTAWSVATVCITSNA